MRKKEEVEMAEKVFTDTNFQSEIANGVAIVDFWAPWCGPCRTQGPIIERLAQRYDGKVKIGKMNVDENSSVPQMFGIKSIPTIIIFKDGKNVKQFVGVQQEQTLSAELDSLIS